MVIGQFEIFYFVFTFLAFLDVNGKKKVANLEKLCLVNKSLKILVDVF